MMTPKNPPLPPPQTKIPLRIGMHLALMICDKVAVYGFTRNWKEKGVKYHYFNNEEPNVAQLARDGKGEMPLIEKLIKANKGRIKMAHG